MSSHCNLFGCSLRRVFVLGISQQQGVSNYGNRESYPVFWIFSFFGFGSPFVSDFDIRISNFDE
jgi:hypothetical protein